MRDAAVDVDTERTLIIVERLARLLGPHQGFKVGADGGVNVYPSSLRVRLPAEKQEGSPRPAKRDSRSGCQGNTRAPNARSHPPQRCSRGDARPKACAGGRPPAAAGWQPRQQGVGRRSSCNQAPRLARSSALQHPAPRIADAVLD